MLNKQSKLIKLSTISLFLLLSCIYYLSEREARANSSGAVPSRTGAPNELTCNTSGCHNSFTLNSGGGSVTITGLPASGYAPGQQITVTVTAARESSNRFGFQLTAVDDQGRAAGTLTVIESGRTQREIGTVGGNARQYITHTTSGTSSNATNQNSWTLRWTAPEQSVGRVTFYAAGNATNNNGQPTGDYIYTTSANLQPASTVAAVAAISAASFATNGALPAQSIAALFGSDLASNTMVADTLPLPTDLGGVKVRITDAASTQRDAALFFVSSGQINFLVPEGTSNGAATITVLRDNSPVGQGSITIDTVAPGLFSANTNGQGVASAVVFRVKADGSQSFEPVAEFNGAAGRFDALPIDLGPETDQVFLIAFGTGFRTRSSLAGVSAAIGGATAEVVFAGPQGGFEGVDQTNIRIPRELAGRGNVDLVFNVDGRVANTVTLNIR